MGTGGRYPRPVTTGDNKLKGEEEGSITLANGYRKRRESME